MKRIDTLVLAALLLVACHGVDPEMDDTQLRTITSLEAVIEQTRTTIADDGTGKQTLWSYEDCIEVSDLTSTATFRLKEGAGTTCGRFGGSIASSAKVLYGIYPASSAVFSGATARIRIPSVQSYTPNRDVNVAARNLMVGMSEDGKEFRFNPIAAMARFSISLGSDELISSITMRCEDELVSGIGTIDFTNSVVGALSAGTVTLSYAAPVSGDDAEGWMIISPVDFSTGSGKVMYDVVTDKGTYTFCRRPSRKFEKGMIYTFPLHLSDFSKVSSESELSDGKYTFTSNSSRLTVRQIRATDSTIAVAWSKTGFPADYSTDIEDRYTLHLCNAEGKEILSWAPGHNQSQCLESTPLFVYDAQDPTYPPRWCFSGLEPDTEYSIYVKDVTTGAISNTLSTATIPVDCGEVVGTALTEGETILFENFSSLIWHGDVIGLAAGYVSASSTSLTDYRDGQALGNWTSTTQTKYQYSDRSSEQNLFTTCASSLGSVGLSEWGYWRNPADDAVSASSTGTYTRAGYMKIGLKKVRAGIVTPEMTALLGNATISVSFKAATYGTSAVKDCTSIAVSALDNCSIDSYRVTGTEVAKKAVSLESVLDWREYTVELSGVTPTSRIMFSGNADDVSQMNNRFCIDDIKIRFVGYDQTVDTSIPTVRQVETDTTSSTIEWKSAETGKFTVSLYTEAACMSAVQSYETTISTDAKYMKWPSRFTFTYLEPGRYYYVTVKSPAGKTSRALRIETAGSASQSDGVVEVARFDNLYWGGDYIHMANALNISGISTATYSPATLEATLQYCKSVTSPTVDGPKIATMSSTLKKLCGLDEWDSNNAFIRPGYLKLGSGIVGGWVMTRAFDNLDGQDRDVAVSLKACPYVTDATVSQTSFIVVSMLNANGEEMSRKELSIDGFRSEPGWKRVSTVFANANNGYRIRIASGGTKASAFCIDDVEITSKDVVAENEVFGNVTYSDGTPAAGIVMSNGFQCTATDGKGYYRMSCTKDVWYIFYSIPEDCQVDTNEFGLPCFFRKYTYGEHRYDFTLTRMASGKESSFTLYCLADPQCKSTDNISRFTSETVPAIRADYATKSGPAYGMTLGDIVFSSGARNNNSLMPNMRTALAMKNFGFPIFQTMGNHDYTYFYTDNPNHADETSSTPNLRAQRAFESNFGPVNYSFNRGDVHIIAMRDIVFNSTTDSKSYGGGFSAEQTEWLAQDLSYVPTSKKVVLCVHIPLNYKYDTSLINPFKEPLVLAGHTHYMENDVKVGNGTAKQHVLAAICGAWWNSNLNGDGCPNGFGVYEFEGNSLKSHYYRGTNDGMNDRNYQIRLYHGNQTTGGYYETFRTQYGGSVILANVFNANSRWKIKVFENDVYSGDMTLMPNVCYEDSNLPYSSDVQPTIVPDDSSQDWWAIAYHVGALGIGHISGSRNSYMTACMHMYRYTLKNANASVRVEATDEYGNTYSQTEFMPVTCTDSTYPKYVVTGN